MAFTSGIDPLQLVLKGAGLVHEEAVGTRRIYRLDAAWVAALREQLDDFWHRALGDFQKLVDRSRRGRKRPHPKRRRAFDIKSW